MSAAAALRAADETARLRASTEFDRPIILEAGAGTGKTSTLVARVVSWSLGPGWEAAARKDEALDRTAARVLGGVVAITFTEAAASEMAERVGQALSTLERGELPRGVRPEMLPMGDTVRQERARALLGALDHLVVRTIHAFCRRLLAAFPLEAGLHPAFEVDATGEALQAVVREVVESRLGEAYALPGDPDYLELAGRGIGPQDLADALTILATGAVPAVALAEDPLGGGPTQGLIGRLQGHTEALLELVGPRLGKGGRVKNARLLVESLDALAQRLRTSGALDVETVQGWAGELLPENLRNHLGKWRRGDLSASEAELLDGVLPDLRATATALDGLLKHVARLDPALLALARRVLHPLLVEVETRLRSRGVQTFSGLLASARELLVRRPDVAARVRAGIDQLLVDEFQDTDRLQCDLIRALALEGHGHRPGLFLVGDPKQSIYGWRSADLRAYDGFVRYVREQGGALYRLSVNFRSAPPILDEVDGLFRKIMVGREGIQPDFQPLIPCEALREAPGFAQAPWAPVEIWASWTRDPETGGPPPKDVLSVDATELEADRLAADLLRLHQEHGVPWREFALLLRSTGNLDVYLGALRQVGIPYAVERDKSYYRRREIIEITSLVRCVLDPNDHLALLTFLRSAAVGVPDAALVPLWAAAFPSAVTELDGPDPRRQQKVDDAIAEAMRKVPDVPGLGRVAGWDRNLRLAMRALADLRDAFEHAPADVFVEKLRTRLVWEPTEAARYHGHYRLANLDRFFRHLMSHLETDGGDPQALLRALRASVAEARDAEEGRPKEVAGDAVQVMTIHKAKGLDFGHVYVLQTHKSNQAPTPPRTVAELCDPPPEALGADQHWEYALFGAPTLGFDRVEAQKREVEASERIRTLYVAMTRPRQRLVLAGSLPRKHVELSQATTYAELLVLREAGVPSLVERMIALGAEGRASRFVERGVTWAFPALMPPASGDGGASDRALALPSLAEVGRQQERLHTARADALARERRPMGGVATPDTTAALRASVAERRYGEGGGEEDAHAGGAGLDQKARLELAIGSAIHRVLETFDLDAPLAAELRRQRGLLPTYLRSLVGARDLKDATRRAESLLDALYHGHLLPRLRALAPQILARELPVLLSPDAAGVPTTAVGFVAGSVDLLYRDPAGPLVVVDYKIDQVRGEAELEQRAALCAAQAAVYVEAITRATGEHPRLELWFIAADRVATLVGDTFTLEDPS